MTNNSWNKSSCEQDGQNNQTAWNVYGTNLISRQVGTDTLTYMYNGHADVTTLLDTSGNLVATYYYDAFGNILEKTGTGDSNILYGGYQYDKETGLYYLNARMYDPITARFLQKDTYRGQYNDPLSLNLYTYCHNEPLMYSDPTGHREMIAANAEKETEKERKKSFTAMKGPKVIAAENTIKAKNTLKSIGYGIAAVGFVAVGILSAGTAVPLEIALAGGAFAGGVALASTEAYDFFDDGKFNKHDSEYYANFAGAVPVGMTGGLSTATFALFKYGPKAVDKITDSVKNSLAKTAAKGAGDFVKVNSDTIISSATAAKKGGETVVGHALQKHAGRNPDIWGKVKGGPEQINQTALNHLDEIINAPSGFSRVTNPNGIQFFEKKLPDGRGVRLNLDGTFKGFIDQ